MIGKIVSHYRITEKLGSGSMGAVYKAEHTRVSLTVAIKLIGEHLAANERAKDRFLREAEAVASLEHPNICRFYEVDETAEGRLYIVMSYVDGGDLGDRLAKGPLPVPDAVEIAALISDGLAHAHHKNVVHRDIKPANLMFTADGELKIVDFGLAMLVDRTQVSQDGTTVGTVLYMSPEQTGTSRVDGRSDVFSLGSVLYEMLTGVAPFAAEHPNSIMYRLANEPHRPVRELRPDVPEPLAAVVDRALQKNPDERFQSARELRDALLAVLADIAPERRPRRAREPVARRRKWQRAAAAAGIVLVLAGLLGWKRDFVTARLGLHRVEASVALLPLLDDAGSHTALVHGLAADLTERLRESTLGRRAPWVVSQGRVQLTKMKRAEDAPGLVGAARVLTLQFEPLTHSTVDLVRLDVFSDPVEHGRLQLSLESDRMETPDIDAAVADLAGIRPRASHGYTTNADAYHDFLVGLGHLGVAPRGLAAADSAFTSAVSRDSTFARAWGGLAETYRLRFAASKDSTWAVRAHAVCERALALDRNLAGARVTEGRLFVAQHDLDAAIASFEAACKLSPAHPDALEALGNAYEAAARSADAEAIFKRATRLNPRDTAAHEMLGYFYYTHERYRDAIDEFQINAALAAGYGETYNYLGACYFAVDCWDQALTAFERSFELGRSYVSCSNLGTLYYLNQRFDDAARMYQWTVEYYRNWQTLSFLAAAYYWLDGRRNDSLELFAQARSLAEAQRAEQGADATLLADLSGLYAVEHSDSAEVLAERAVREASGNAAVLYRAAMTLEIIGKRERALVVLASAINHGYSVRQIGSEQFLADLRKDMRYEFLMKSVSPPLECSRVEYRKKGGSP